MGVGRLSLPGGVSCWPGHTSRGVTMLSPMTLPWAHTGVRLGRKLSDSRNKELWALFNSFSATCSAETTPLLPLQVPLQWPLLLGAFHVTHHIPADDDEAGMYNAVEVLGWHGEAGTIGMSLSFNAGSSMGKVSQSVQYVGR